jgi:hypothetical protein
VHAPGREALHVPHLAPTPPSDCRNDNGVPVFPHPADRRPARKDGLNVKDDLSANDLLPSECGYNQTMKE